MTQREFIAASLKLIGFVVLLLGLLEMTRGGIMAAANFAQIQRMSGRQGERANDPLVNSLLATTARMKQSLMVSLGLIPIGAVQALAGYYLCRREQRVVNFLLPRPPAGV